MNKTSDLTGTRPSGTGAAMVRGGFDPVGMAYRLLWVGFIALPIVMGLDKFTNLLATWPDYLAPWIVGLLPFSAEAAMRVVGVIEIVAGLAVAVRPRYGAPIVALWLGGIILNLLTYSGYYDVALRDVGLLIGAVALWLLAMAHEHGHGRSLAHDRTATVAPEHVSISRMSFLGPQFLRGDAEPRHAPTPPQPKSRS